MSWPIASVRGSGRDKVGLVRSNVLLLHLVGIERKLRESVRTLPACRKSARQRRAYQNSAKREAAKHVESFGVGFWIRVRFPAPPPSQNFGLRIADLKARAYLHAIHKVHNVHTVHTSIRG